MLKRVFVQIILAAFLVFISFSMLASSANAEDRRSYVGEVGSFTNDFFGDGHDRWRSGSYQRSYYSEGLQFSRIRGIELRTRGELFTPWRPTPRQELNVLYSTLLGFGASAHTTIAGLDTRAGAEFLLLGDLSGLEFVQRTFHEGMGMEKSFDPSRDDVESVKNGIDFRLDLEVGRKLRLNGTSIVRPYAEFVVGADEAISVGADLIFGNLASAERWTRDVVTGRLLTPEVNQIRGISFIGGWDTRSVYSSVHLPRNSAVELEPVQHRVRMGIQSSTGFTNFFIGQAWISPDFVGQPESQRLGMLSVSFAF